MAAYIKTLYFSQSDFCRPPLRDPKSGEERYTLSLHNANDLILTHMSAGPCTFCVSVGKGRDGKQKVRFSLYDANFILAEREEELLFDVVMALSGEKIALISYLTATLGHWFRKPQPDFLDTVAGGLRVGLRDMIEAMKKHHEVSGRATPGRPLSGGEDTARITA